MSSIEKWVERVYSETDFGRSIATSVASIAGLSVYLLVRDWVIALFSSAIIFPVARLAATGLHNKAQRAAKRRLEREEADDTYERLSDEEKEIVDAFVAAGGSVLTWSQVNKLNIASAAVESLMNREVVRDSVTADGMRETFVLDSALFDAALRKARRKGLSRTG